MSLIVFGTSVSPFVRKVRIVLTEKGLLYRHENVNEAKPPDGWRELSPLGKIPAFKDCDRALAGSSVICAYLERRFPMPPLYPSEPYDYARALWFENYMDDGFAPLGRSKVFLPLIVEPLLAGKPEADVAAQEAAGKAVDKEFPAFWDYLERELGDGEFFVGERLTIADIAIANAHVNLRYAGVAPARNRWPRLRAFLDRMHSRSSFSNLVEEEAPIFDRLSGRISD